MVWARVLELASGAGVGVAGVGGKGVVGAITGERVLFKKLGSQLGVPLSESKHSHLAGVESKLQTPRPEQPAGQNS